MRNETGSARRFDQLVDLAARSEAEAALNLRQQQKRIADLMEEVALLRRYRADYAGRASLSLNKPQTVDVLRHTQQFVRTLDDAVTLKLGQLQSEENGLNLCRDRWQESHQRHMALKRVRDERLAELRIQQTRTEFNRNDELINNRVTSQPKE